METSKEAVIGEKIVPVIFQGKTSEYFGVWIVNLLLSLVTLGIYSAWSKVRRKKYFYNNTLIENVGFDYHAKPTSILKGRLIAVAFFAGYGMSPSIHPFLPAVFLGVFFIGLPWLVVRGSLFNARNTSHRGLRFNFVGKLFKAVQIFVGLPILLFGVPIILASVWAFTQQNIFFSLMRLPLIIFSSICLFIPYIAYRKKVFSVNNYQFGLSQFELKVKLKDFYKVYSKMLGVFILLVFVFGIIVGGLIRGQELLSKRNSPPSFNNLAETKLLAEVQVVSVPHKVERVYSEEKSPEPSKEKVQVLSEMQKLQRATQGKSEQKLSVGERLKKRIEELKQQALDVLLHPKKLLNLLYGFAVYALFHCYLQARIGNLTWNNTVFENLSFKSTLRARDLIWLYFTNFIIIAFTFGLATPWAQIRMARYRASKLQIVGDVDFDQFVGDKKAEVTATGEEIADFFDVDLSFG